VNLDVAEQRAGVPSVGAHARRVAAESLDGLGHGDACRIGAVEDRAVEAARHRAAAEVSRAEPQALLVGDGDHLDGEGQAPAGVLQALDRGDGDDNPERAVVLSRVADAVEMRPQDESRCSGSDRLVSAVKVADVVVPHGHAGLAHPALHLRTSAPHGLARKLSRQPARLIADPTKNVEPLHARRG